MVWNKTCLIRKEGEEYERNAETFTWKIGARYFCIMHFVFHNHPAVNY